MSPHGPCTLCARRARRRKLRALIRHWLKRANPSRSGGLEN